jgi:LAS superfamily LD-carboxypeptidase LdcB
MLTLKELNRRKFTTTPQIDANLADLIARMNKVRAAYGMPMTVTTGYRTWDDHVRIYRENAAKAGKTFDINKVPKGSKHLSGQAVDIADSSGKLYSWCKANEPILAAAGLYLEERMGGWQHFQSVAPGSGNRWFFP